MEKKSSTLDSLRIGRNFATVRGLRGKKARDVAAYIGISEAAYGKYERGESKISIDLIQKVADCLNVDPIELISMTPQNIFENVHNSLNAGYCNYVGGDFNTTSEKQNEAMIKLMERLIKLLEQK